MHHWVSTLWRIESKMAPEIRLNLEHNFFGIATANETSHTPLPITHRHHWTYSIKFDRPGPYRDLRYRRDSASRY